MSRYLGKSFEESSFNTSFELCEYLLEKHLVALIPGSAFGAEGFVRFSFAASEDDISEGVRRFSEGILALS